MNNDTRRYFSSEDLEKELIPLLMKLDKYFATTRKYIMAKYNIQDASVKSNIELESRKPHKILENQTSNPLNYFRALESEKEKREFLQLMHRNMGFGSGSWRNERRSWTKAYTNYIYLVTIFNLLYFILANFIFL